MVFLGYTRSTEDNDGAGNNVNHDGLAENVSKGKNIKSLEIILRIFLQRM